MLRALDKAGVATPLGAGHRIGVSPPTPLGAGAASLHVSGLYKSYGNVPALVDVSVSVGPGEIACILGPTGSGKTTLLECVEGLRTPDKGTIHICGQDFTRSRSRPPSVGVQLQEEQLPARIKVGEALRLYSTVYDVARFPQGLVTRLGLAGLLPRRFDSLSACQRRRVVLVLAFMADPALVLLDEPTSGLDPEFHRIVLALLTEMAVAGTAIVATSHDLSLASDVADRVVVMSGGRVLAAGFPGTLVEAVGLDSCLSVPRSLRTLVRDDIARAQHLVGHDTDDGEFVVYGAQSALARIIDRLGLARQGDRWTVRGADLGDVVTLATAGQDAGR